MSRDTTLPTGASTVAVAPAYVARHAVSIGLATPLLYCEGPGSLVIGPDTYVEAALSVGPVSVAEVPAVTIRVPNDTNQISDPDANGDHVRLAAVVVYEVMWNPSTGAQLDATELFRGVISTVKYNAGMAELACISREATSAGMVGRIQGRLCSYVFKGSRCAYAGAATSCDHALATCTSLGNQVRYGGWPSMPVIGTKFAYTVTVQQGVSGRTGTQAPPPDTTPPKPVVYGPAGVGRVGPRPGRG